MLFYSYHYVTIRQFESYWEVLTSRKEPEHMLLLPTFQNSLRFCFEEQSIQTLRFLYSHEPCYWHLKLMKSHGYILHWRLYHYFSYMHAIKVLEFPFTVQVFHTTQRHKNKANVKISWVIVAWQQMKVPFHEYNEYNYIQRIEGYPKCFLAFSKIVAGK